MTMKREIIVGITTISIVLVVVLGAHAYTLQIRVTSLEENLMLPHGFVSAPAYDSGWVSLPNGSPGVTLQHGLNTKEVFVYMIGKSPEDVIHIYKYGWDWANTRMTGAYWFNLTDTEITVWRGRDDYLLRDNWDQTRIMIWKIPESTS